MDERTPVIVGAAQVVVRDGAPDLERTPLEMMAAAVDAAGHDAGAPGLLGEAGLWIASAGVFRYRDPARLVAHRHGAGDAECLLTNFGGNQPQAAVAEVSARIQAGELSVGVVLGGEAERNRRQLAAGGEHLDSTHPDDGPAPRFGSETPIPNDVEIAAGAGVPAVAYALFESALRADRGESLVVNESLLGELWATFSQIAARNPSAWSREPAPAAAIAAPSADNRMVAYPYTKAMCANPQVDMSAALIVCSAERARAHGIPADRWVFPFASATGYDTVELLTRHRLHGSEAISPVAAAALDAAGVGIDDVALVDLYACFPSIVRMAADAIGLDTSRELTVTGGLNFGGGPLNNANLHSIASMVDRLRHEPDAYGLVHGNGGYATKHSIGIYGTSPPVRAFTDVDAQPLVDQRPRTPEPDFVGPGEMVAVTVIHEREGPEAVLAVLDTEAGTRAFARSSVPAVMDLASAQELVGRPAHRGSGGELMLD